jgi:hypothetical protein
VRPTCAYCGDTLDLEDGLQADTGYCREECLKADLEADRAFDEAYYGYDTLEEAAEEGRGFEV